MRKILVVICMCLAVLSSPLVTNAENKKVEVAFIAKDNTGYQRAIVVCEPGIIKRYAIMDGTSSNVSTDDMLFGNTDRIGSSQFYNITGRSELSAYVVDYGMNKEQVLNWLSRKVESFNREAVGRMLE